ncbi:MAG: glycosyltransferase family 4 protein [Desulfobulbus sp.]
MKLNNIYYILRSFPNVSETFISDEIFSMYNWGVTPHILTFKKGNTKTVHPSAEILQNAGIVTLVSPVSKSTALKAVLGLFMIKPFHTLICFVKAVFSPERWLFFQAAPYALSILQKKTDFIHAHFADFNSLFASVLSTWTGIPFGITTHGYDLRNDPIPLNRARQLFLQANLVITISEYNQHLMVSKYDIPVEKIKIIHCGIDLSQFRYSGNAKKFNQKKLRLINVGRLVPEKGQDILIKSLSEIKNRGIDYDLMIIGSGPLQDELVNLSEKHGLNSCIFFAGAQSQRNVASMLEESDIFILSSRNEGIPVACMEAMAVGTLVIAPRINGIPELIHDRINGLLFDSENILQLTEIICWVNENKKCLNNICSNARIKIENEFEREKCTEQLIQHIENKT